MSNELILAISGNDIFSGGGLHADLATYTVNKQHGFVAVTCLTALTENGFEVIPVDTEVFKQQLNSLEDVPFAAMKLGLLPNIEIAELALEFIKRHPNIPVVLDPVLVCKETHDVEVSELRQELLKLFPYASIVTPNLPEVELLIQKPVQTIDDMKSAAKELYQLGVKTVVIKGGNRLKSDKAIDVFYDGEGFSIIEAPVLEKNNTGAGCTFASSIASSLAKNIPILSAVQSAKEFVYKSIQQSNQFGVIQYEE